MLFAFLESPIEKHGTVFPALLPTYCWTSVVTSWQTLAELGCNKTCQYQC